MKISNGTKVQDSNKAYHSKPLASASSLKVIHSKSPAHMIVGREEEKKRTDALMYGSAFHYYMEGESVFNKYCTVLDEENRPDKSVGIKGKLNQYWKKELLEKYEVVTPEGFDSLKTMVSHLKNDQFISGILKGSESEVSFYIDITILDDQLNEYTVKCKLRVDTIKEYPNRIVIVDWKTCVDPKQDVYEKDAATYLLPIQAAFYSDLLTEFFGKEVVFYFIAIEKTAPFCYEKYTPSESFLEAGRALYRKALITYAKCEQSGNWWGYQDEPNGNGKFNIKELDLPYWFYNQNGLYHLK